jgi:hypothetical protein
MQKTWSPAALLLLCVCVFIEPLPSSGQFFSHPVTMLPPKRNTAISSSPMGHAYDVCDWPSEWHFNIMLALMLLLLALWGQKFLKCQCSYSASSLFFHLGGARFLHNVLSLVFCSLLEELTTTFMTSRTRVCLRASSSVFLPPRSAVLYLGLLSHCWMPSLVPYEHGPHLVQERHCGSTVWWWWQILVRAHHHLGSAFSAGCGNMWPDAGPKFGQVPWQPPCVLLL